MKNSKFEEKLSKVFISKKKYLVLPFLIANIIILLTVASVGYPYSIFDEGMVPVIISLEVMALIGTLILTKSFSDYCYVLENYILDEMAVKVFLNKKIREAEYNSLLASSITQGRIKKYNDLLHTLIVTVPDTTIFNVEDIYEKIEREDNYMEGYEK